MARMKQKVRKIGGRGVVKFKSAKSEFQALHLSTFNNKQTEIN
jgi:hypothetical protein